jgi:hypothetical protein
MSGVNGASNQAVAARGVSGNTFAFVKEGSDAAKSMPAHDTWHSRKADDPYRQEWDSFAKLLGLNGQNKANFPLIKDAMNRYVEKVLTASKRGVEPRASAKTEAAQETLKASFALKESRALAALTAPRGGLTGIAKAGIATLANDAALAKTEWGPALQASLTGVKTQLSFYRGVAEGVFSGGKDLVVGLATIVGKTAQYVTDSTLGLIVDPIRSVLPSGAQEWMRQNEAIPSAERSRATTEKMIDTVGNVGSYIANHSPEQVGADIRDFVGKNWDALKADHAAAAAKGPEAEARWWGNVTGRAVFEVASIAVPITKLGLVGKLADGAADLVRLGGKVTDLGKLAEVTRGAITVAREAILGTQLGAAARDKIQDTLNALRKVETDALPAAEQRALREAKASLEDALEISAPRDPLIGNPAAIAQGYGTLSKGQQKLLDALPGGDKNSITLAKNEVSMTDIAALTAHTGQEFAIFTNGSRRMVLRGDQTSISLNANLVSKLKSEGWRWSAHTQPGLETRHAVASASDQNVLKTLGQEQSLILNSRGERNVFTQTDISLIQPK